MDKIPGYIYPQEVVTLSGLAQKVKGGIIVELGSYLGKSASVLASMAGKDTMIYCVDLWDNSAMGKEPKRNTYDEFIKNTKPWKDRIVPIKSSTNEGWLFTGTVAPFGFCEKYKHLFCNIDLLFIDADHSYESCTSDLYCWYPHVKKGGTVVFHDYTEKGCGVKEATDEFLSRQFPLQEKRISCSMLVVTK